MLSSGSLVSLATAVAIAFAEGKSVQETQVLSAFFTQIGDTLTTIALQRELCEDLLSPDTSTNDTSSNQEITLDDESTSAQETSSSDDSE